MNPRQRRGILFMLIAVLLAVAVFFLVARYVSNVNTKVGNLVTVYRASDEISPYETFEEDMFVTEDVPARWLGKSTITDPEEFLDRKSSLTIEPGTMVTRDMLLDESTLSPTEREVAINVDAVTGLAGRVQTGDYVDIYAVFKEVPGVNDQVQVLNRTVRVVSVRGVQTVPDEDSVTGEQDVIPVTLALEPNDALAVTYASAFAEEVRLVGLPTTEAEDRSGEEDYFDAEKLNELEAGDGADSEDDDSDESDESEESD